MLDSELKKNGIQSGMVEINGMILCIQGYFELLKLFLEQYPGIDGIMVADLPVVAFLRATLEFILYLGNW